MLYSVITLIDKIDILRRRTNGVQDGYYNY